MSALGERRQRANDEARSRYRTWPDACDAAIEAATRVHVDDAIVQAARPGTVPGSVTWTRMRAKIVRAFEAAGFEVTT
jgi:hypothetical protein